jgi:hypothetical protein
MNQPLADAVFWIAALACAVAELAILRSTFAAGRVEKSDLLPSAAKIGELAWAVIPALMLCALLVVTRQRIEARESHMQMMDHSGMEQSMPMPPTASPGSER